MDIQKNQNAYHPSLGLVVSSFRGNFYSDDFKTLCRQTIHLIKEHQAKRLLVDTSELDMVSRENRAWIQDFWFPEAIAAGLTHIAFIMPDTVFGRTVVKDANKGTYEQLKIRYFSGQDDALSWLLS